MALPSQPPMWYGGEGWLLQKKWGNGTNNSSTPNKRRAKIRTGTGTTSEHRENVSVVPTSKAYYNSLTGKKELEFHEARRKAGLPFRAYVLL